MARRSNEIRKRDKLPDWFSLEKYQFASGLNVAAWYEQLYSRKTLISMVNKNFNNGALLSHIQEILKMVRDNPFIDVAANDLYQIYLDGGALHEIKTGNITYSPGVHFSTVRDHYLVEMGIEVEKRNYARAFFKQIENGFLDKPLKYKYQDWINEPVDSLQGHYTKNLRVNLAIPDSVLIEQFKSLLQKQRRSLASVGCTLDSKHRPNFSAWCKFGLLPYIDLKTWEIETGKNIPNRVMADAIFPTGEGGDDVVRKTTAKHAEETLDNAFLEKLAALAAQESGTK